jgi:hypothetical protein
MGRKKYFLKSFSNEQLIRTYELLSQRDDLPTFYGQLSPQHLWNQMAPVGTAVADSTWLLWYEHPLSLHGPDADGLQPLLARQLVRRILAWRYADVALRRHRLVFCAHRWLA